MSTIQDAFARIQRRKAIVLATLALGLVAIVFFLRLTPRAYQASAQVFTVGARDGRDSAVNAVDLPSVATSTVVLQRVIAHLNLALTIPELKGSVKAQLPQGSSIMTIGYRSSTPDRAVAVPNAVADELSKYYEEISTRQSDSDIRKLSAAVDAERARLQSIQKKLTDARVGGVILSDDKALESLAAHYEDLVSQRAMAKAAYDGDLAQANAQARTEAAFSKLGRHEILQLDSYYQELSKERAKDRAQLDVDRGLFRPAYPGFAGLTAKVRSEDEALAGAQRQILSAPDAVSSAQEANRVQSVRARATVEADRAKLSALDGLLASDTARLQSIPQLEISTNWLRLESDATKANYLALSARLSTAVANRSLALGSLVVLDRAVRADTVLVGLGRTRLILMLSVLVVALALMSAFLADAIDPRFVDSESIENLYGAPLVTTLRSKV